MTTIVKRYGMLVLPIFALGWAARGIADGLPWWLTIFISLVLLTAATFAAMARPKPARKPFHAELDDYLRRNDSMLIARELASSKGLTINIVPSDLVPPKMAYFVNGEEIDRIMRDMPAPLFQSVDNKHLPGCRRRNDATAPCICGERGFGGPRATPPSWYRSPCTQSVGCPAHLGRPCPPKIDPEGS